jgi:hypothetical protein
MANTTIPSELIADGAISLAKLDVTDGTNGQALTTNGSGTLSFADVEAATVSATAPSSPAEGDIGLTHQHQQ